MGSLLKNRYCSTLFIAAVFIVTIPFTIAQDAMKPKLTESSEFEVIGIEARTNNAQESGGDGAIPKQWQRLFMENLLSRIPDRLDQSIVAVYSNYASDWNGNYTYILGAKVKPGTKAPEGMVAKNVSAGKFEEFTSKRGRPEQVVPDMWKEVWTYFQAPGNPMRAYGSDFEIYDDLSDPTNMRVRLFVGVKP
jgi:predicted transcriptional regulator YdeE